jgi:hypothetical protein
MPSPVVRSTSERNGRPASLPKSFRSCAGRVSAAREGKRGRTYLPRHVRPDTLQQHLDPRPPRRRGRTVPTPRRAIPGRALARPALLGELDHDRLPEQLGAVEFRDGVFGVAGVFEFDEAEAGHETAFADLEVAEELSFGGWSVWRFDERGEDAYLFDVILPDVRCKFADVDSS